MKRNRRVYARSSRLRSSRNPYSVELAQVIGGAILLVLSVLYIIFALYISAILAEIQHKDFSLANIRLRKYEAFFEKLQRQGFEVDESSPYIKEGKKNFLWVVTVPDSGKRLIYRWRHDLESNEVEPLTSHATYLDIQLGYINPKDAMNYPYEPGDEVARRVASGTYDLKLALQEAKAQEESSEDQVETEGAEEEKESAEAEQEQASPEEETEEEKSSGEREGASVDVIGGSEEDSEVEKESEDGGQEETENQSELEEEDQGTQPSEETDSKDDEGSDEDPDQGKEEG